MNVVMNKGNVCCIKDFLTSDEADYINQFCRVIPPSTGSTGKQELYIDPDAPNPDERGMGQTDPNIRSSEIRWLDSGTLPEEMVTKIYTQTQQVVSEVMKSTLEFYITEQWQHTTYYGCKDFGDHYTWHQDDQFISQYPYVDGNGAPFIRKISASLILNDPSEYEGGDFQFVEWERVFDRIPENGKLDVNNQIWTMPYSSTAKGSIVIFPSLTHHRIKPVKWGTRNSLVMWFGGAPYV